MPRSGLMSSLSPDEGLEAMLRGLSADSPASPSRSLAKSLALATNAICSEMSCESLMNLDASCSFWKTRQVCLFPIQTDETNLPQFQTFLGSWPKAALIVHGCLYQRRTWEVRTVENGGGVSLGANWPTPTKEEDMTVRMFKSLTRDVQNWATPRFEDSQCAGSRVTRGVNDTLYSQTRAWGTPRAQDCKGTGPKGTVSQLHRLKKGYLDAQVEEIADGGRKDESLNPDWEEILMGWEPGWTDPTKPCGTFPGWPMGQGYEQFDYEPPRTLPRKLMTGRTARIKMIGNGIVPQAATLAYVKLLRLLLQLP
jgi:hypothetical protein